MRRSECLRCKCDLEGSHFKRKRCSSCAAELRRRPVAHLTPDQEQEVLALVGRLHRPDIADRTGLSPASVSRFLRDHNISAHIPRYSQATEQAVIDYFEAYGKVGIKQAFPDVAHRSIIERRHHKPRLRRWNGPDLLAAVKMAGLVPLTVQAALLKRPRAAEGSIRSMWRKKMRQTGSSLHGLNPTMAKVFLRKGFLTVPIAYRYSCIAIQDKKTVLWCDMLPYFRPDMPFFLRDGIKAMQEFQCWIFDDPNPRKQIMEIVRRGHECAAYV